MKTSSYRFVLSLVVIFIILLMLRLALPDMIRLYLNQQLDSIEGYHGHVQSVSLCVLCADVALNQIALTKTEGDHMEIQIPKLFVAIKRIHIKEGHILMDVSSDSPMISVTRLSGVPLLSLLTEKKAKAPTVKPTVLWRESRQKFQGIPLDNIDFTGVIHFEDQTVKPYLVVDVSNLKMALNHLQPAKNETDTLPSDLRLSGNILKTGQFNFAMQFDPRAKKPAFKFEGQLEDIPLNQLNALFSPHTDLRFRAGQFSLYVEAAALNNHIKAYAKPFLTNIQLDLPPKKKSNPFKRLYRNVVQGLTHVLKNNETQKNATKVEIAGHIDDPDMSTWAVIKHLLRNAFVEALWPEIEHSLDVIPA